MVDWTRYLDLAESLRASDDEAALRSAISRASDAVYHVATETVRVRSIVEPHGHRVWEQPRDVGRARGRPDLVVVGQRGFLLKR